MGSVGQNDTWHWHLASFWTRRDSQSQTHTTHRRKTRSASRPSRKAYPGVVDVGQFERSESAAELEGLQEFQVGFQRIQVPSSCASSSASSVSTSSTDISEVEEEVMILVHRHSDGA